MLDTRSGGRDAYASLRSYAPERALLAHVCTRCDEPAPWLVLGNGPRGAFAEPLCAAHVEALRKEQGR